MRSVTSYSLFIPNWVILAVVCISGHYILLWKADRTVQFTHVKYKTSHGRHPSALKKCAQLCTSLPKFKRKTHFGKKFPDSETREIGQIPDHWLLAHGLGAQQGLKHSVTNTQPGNHLQWKLCARLGSSTQGAWMCHKRTFPNSHCWPLGNKSASNLD